MGTNRIAKYLDGTANAKTPDELGESRMSTKTHSSNGMATTAALITKAIEERWVGTDKSLAEAAGVSVSSLADMKANGTRPKNTNFRKICAALKIDLRAAARGKIVPLGEVSMARRQDLHSLLDRIVGTDDEPTIERVMRGLLKAKD